MLRHAMHLLGLFTFAAAVMLAATPAGAADDDSAHYSRCMALAARDPAIALADATQWIKTGGAAPAEHCAARALAGLKRYGEAAARLDALAHAATTPGGMRAEIFSQAGNAWLLAGNGAKAVASLRAALTISAGDADLFTDLGRADAMLRNWKEAILDLNAAIRLRRDASLLVLRASAYRAVKNYHAALTDLNAALALKPGNGDALLERGLLRRDLGDIGGARKDFEAAQKSGSAIVKRDAAGALDAIKE
jgi:tetratricopeptide (TPR) repeat protein